MTTIYVPEEPTAKPYVAYMIYEPHPIVQARALEESSRNRFIVTLNGEVAEGYHPLPKTLVDSIIKQGGTVTTKEVKRTSGTNELFGIKDITVRKLFDGKKLDKIRIRIDADTENELTKKIFIIDTEFKRFGVRYVGCKRPIIPIKK